MPVKRSKKVTTTLELDGLKFRYQYTKISTSDHVTEERVEMLTKRNRGIGYYPHSHISIPEGEGCAETWISQVMIDLQMLKDAIIESRKA